MLATNLTELIRTEALCDLLRLCGVKECLLTHGSDYEFLLAVSEVSPLLQGHPFPQGLQRFLEEHFAITQPLTKDTVDEIWRTVADDLLKQPREIPAAPLPHSVASLSLPQPVPQANAVLWRADGLTSTHAVTWEEWEKELYAALEKEMERGVSHVLFTLTNATVQRIPDPFHVGKILENSAKTAEDHALLGAQLVRFFCVAAEKRGLTLVLSVEADTENAISFLGRMERTVGLPSLIVIAGKEPAQSLLAFAARVHRRPFTLAIDRASYPTDAAFERAASALAACYPLGCLSVLDGGCLKSFAMETITQI